MNRIQRLLHAFSLTAPAAPRRVQIVTILAALLVFLALKWTVVTLTFAGTTHPELDDTYHYLSNIERNATVGLAPLGADGITTYQYWLAWTVAMAGLRRLLPTLSPEGTFQLNFYLGLLLMALTLAWFGWRVRGWLLAALSVTVLAVFYGAGSYHGFYWVVPSFYLLLLLLLAMIQLIPHPDETPVPTWRAALRDRALPWMALLGGLAALTHLSSPVVLAILAAYAVLLMLLERRIARCVAVRAAIFALAFGLTLGGWQLLGALDAVPEMLPLAATAGPTDSSVTGLLRGGLDAYLGQPIGQWPLVRDLLDLYLGWFWASGTLERFIYTLAMGGPFLLGLLVNLFADRHKALSAFYGATLAAFIGLSVVSGRGERLMIYLFPATFLLAAYGYFLLFSTAYRLWQAPAARRWGLALGAGAAVLLIALLGRSALRQITTAQGIGRAESAQIIWEQTCVDDVLAATAPGDLVAYNRDLALHFWLTRGMTARPARYLASAGDLLAETGQASLYVFCEDFTAGEAICTAETLEAAAPVSVTAVERVRACGDFSLFRLTLRP